MKNKVTIFVGPARSGKSILIHSYIDVWGGLKKIAYCGCHTGYKPEDVGVYERSRGSYIRWFA